MSKIQHKGRATYRFNDNPEERRFAEAWQAHNDQGQTLAYLLNPERSESARPPDPSARDIEVAATVVQWLGSPVGQGFLRDLGYVREAEETATTDGAWDDAHELAALERLFEIGRQRMIDFGVAEMSTARNLACRATTTEREFTIALKQLARMTPEQVRIEVARVYRVVAERGQP